MKRSMLWVTALTLWLFTPCFATGAEEHASGEPLRAAIFLQNRADEELTEKLEMLNDLISTRLTGKGFSIIDRSIVLAKFRESRNSDPVLSRNISTLADAAQGNKSEGSIEDALSGASALRISQMIGADYLVVASITSLGSESRTFKGEGTIYGSDNLTNIYTLRISLKVLEGNSGGSVYGDTVTASERVSVGKNLVIASSDTLNRLFEKGAMKIADNIADKTGKIRDVKVRTAAAVEFTVNSNVDGASVELDGAVIGSTPGRFMAPPGLHQLRIVKQWLTPWEKTVNIFSGQVMNVTLELSREGLERYVTLERLKSELVREQMRTDLEGKEREAAIAIGREQSAADAHAKKAVAEGEKIKRENSYEKLEGEPAPTNINNVYR